MRRPFFERSASATATALSLGLALTLALAQQAGAQESSPDRAPALALKPFRLVTNGNLQSPAILQSYAVAQVALRRLGYLPSLVSEPGERALASLEAGVYDADLSRVARFAEAYPQGLRIEPHLATVWYMAVSSSPEVSPQDWRDLGHLRVAYVRGVKAVELEAAVARRIERPNTREACLTMVALGRVDVCVLNVPEGYRPPAQLRGAALHWHMLGHLNLYMWLAPQHQGLAVQLKELLQAMERSGELQRLAGTRRLP